MSQISSLQRQLSELAKRVEDLAAAVRSLDEREHDATLEQRTLAASMLDNNNACVRGLIARVEALETERRLSSGALAGLM